MSQPICAFCGRPKNQVGILITGVEGNICDDCIKENLADATLLYYGNYMYGSEGFVGDEIEKSKQKYRRRKNLDDIV